MKIDSKIIKMYKSNISIKDIVLLCNVSLSYIDRLLKRNNIKRERKTGPRNKIYVNEKYFLSIDTGEKAYWLGFIFADGCTQIRNGSYSFELAIKKDDIKHLYKFKKCINSNHSITRSQNCYRIRIVRKEFVENLIKLGAVPDKTFKLEWPIIDKKFTRDFIRGYIDGDGCWGLNNGQLYFSILGASKPFIEKFIEILNNECCISMKIKKRKYENVYRSYCYNRQDCAKIYNYLYYDKCICLERKFKKSTKNLKK